MRTSRFNNVDNQIRRGSVTEKITQTGKVSGYQIEIWHDGLNEHKYLSGPEKDILWHKVEAQADKWNDNWIKVKQKNKLEREKRQNKEYADTKTKEALKLLDDIDRILIHTLGVDDTVNWDKLKKIKPYTRDYLKRNPFFIYNKYGKPIDIKRDELVEPLNSDKKYIPKLSLFDKLISSRKQKKIEEKTKQFISDYETWKSKKSEIEYLFEMEKIKWEIEESEYNVEVAEHNSKIEKLRKNYLKKIPEAIVENCELVLNNSKYPDFISPNFQIQYKEENKLLVVEYFLPSLDKFPTLKEVKYVITKNELKEYHLSETQLNAIYDKALYDITLRSIHELFEADSVNAIQSIAFNGWVEFNNPSNGKLEQTCLLSVQTNKGEFMDINLAKVDPKRCFKSLKGVGSAKLHGMSAIVPIMQIDKEDRRFISSVEVVAGMDSRTNLAAMDWADFEHLIREIFEKEFISNGGEVKVTQASSDGGVDAIAFDPDPIRGGKIVIQAKRYTNTVSVSAVRDLYGTVLNEGATKGILVTTADFGTDSYSFAKDKPITLLNGSNLLHLLEKHGHKATIDIKAAKLLQKK